MNINNNAQNYFLKICSGVFRQDVSLYSQRSEIVTWNSLKHIELIVKIQKAFNVRLNTEDIIKVDSINELYTLIQNNSVD